MHELSVCQSLLTQVQTVARNNRATAVTEVHVSVGPLSGVEPPLLDRAFTVARAGTVAANAELILTAPGIRVHCHLCAKETEVALPDLRCGACGHWQTRVLAGDELMLTSVALERPSNPPSTPHV